MANISQYIREGESVQHTPTSAVSAGNLINIGAVCGFSPRDIAASALGTLMIGGVIRAPFVGGVANVGDNIWWDADATPYGGAADGACDRNGANGDWWVGTLMKATTATSTTCDVALNLVNTNLPAWIGKTHQTTAIDKLLAAAADSGTVFHMTADTRSFTLPAAVVGMEFILQNDVADAGSKTRIVPDGTETIEVGNAVAVGGTATLNNTKITSIRGDYAWLEAVELGAGVAWKVKELRGTWAAVADR